MSKKAAQADHGLTIDTSGGTHLLDGNLQWIVKYHLAMAAHMLSDFSSAQNVRRSNSYIH
jgi:hypothetical protein